MRWGRFARSCIVGVLALHPAAGAYAQDDHGDTSATATLLPFGASRAGRIDDGTDADVFRIDLLGRAEIEIRTVGSTDTAGELLDSTGARLMSDDDGGPGDNFAMTVELEPGAYYVEVRGDAGGYAVNARLGGVPDHGDTVDSSTLLKLHLGEELAAVRPQVLLATSGRIHPSTDDADVFRIDVADDGTRIVLRTSGGVDTYASLVDSSENGIAFDDGDGNFRIERTLDAGIYYVKVGGHGTGAYRILGTRVPPPDSGASRPVGTRPRLLSPGAIRMEWPPWETYVAHDRIGLRFAGDFDGDGDDDLVVVGSSRSPAKPGSGLVLLNNGDFTFTVADGDRPSGVHAREALAADFDGDGRTDFFIADHGFDRAPFQGWRNQLLLWTADGYDDATDRLPADPAGYTHNAAAGDVDGDGDVDLLVANSFPARISGESVFGPYFLLNDGQANFVVDTGALPDAMKSEFRPWAVDLVDLDGDGHDDLVAGATSEDYGMEGVSFVFWGSVDGTYRQDNATVLPRAGFFASFGTAEVVSISVHDCNGDGLPDLLFGGYHSDTTRNTRGVQLLVNRGGRYFADETRSRLGDHAWSADEGWQSEHRFFDFNHDGTVDIVPEGYAGLVDGGPNVMAWLNDGTCNYVALRTTEFDDAGALQHFAWGTIVRVGADFKAMWFGGDGATHLTAKAAVVVEGAEITLAPSAPPDGE